MAQKADRLNKVTLLPSAAFFKISPLSYIFGQAALHFWNQHLEPDEMRYYMHGFPKHWQFSLLKVYACSGWETISRTEKFIKQKMLSTKKYIPGVDKVNPQKMSKL